MNGLSLRIETAQRRCFDLRMHLNHVYRTLKEDIQETAPDDEEAEKTCNQLERDFKEAIRIVDRSEKQHSEFLRRK